MPRLQAPPLLAMLLPVRRKPLYVALVMVRTAIAWPLTFRSWLARVTRYAAETAADIKDGKRQVLEMTGMLTNLGDQDLADIAAYFSSQKAQSVPPIQPWWPKGEALFRGGQT